QYIIYTVAVWRDHILYMQCKERQRTNTAGKLHTNLKVECNVCSYIIEHIGILPGKAVIYGIFQRSVTWVVSGKSKRICLEIRVDYLRYLCLNNLSCEGGSTFSVTNSYCINPHLIYCDSL